MDEDGEQRTPLTKDQLDRVSEAITSDWQKLGLKMGYQKDEVPLKFWCQSGSI